MILPEQDAAMPVKRPQTHFLQQLPEELLHDILDRLEKRSLSTLNLVSRWCYEAASPLIWRDVQLVDCRTEHEDGFDDHDDTPLLRKLLILAKYATSLDLRMGHLS